MAEKLLTLIQDTTGDEIYPNVKEDNLPPSVRDKLQEVDSKQDKLTDTQMYAVNSGITQYKVATYDGYADEIAKKQNKITTSTVNPFVLTDLRKGVDLYQIKLDANGKLVLGDVVTRVPTDTHLEEETDEIYAKFNKISLDTTERNSITLNINHKTGETPIFQGKEISFPSINRINIVNSAGIYYAPTDINETDTQMFLSCTNGNMEWVTSPTISTDYLQSVKEITKSNRRALRFTYWDGYTEDYYLDNFKQINIFGNHSILVPNSSTDTNINLYNHAIEISFQYDQNQASYQVYLNVVSSKNLNVDSITNLKALLGNTFTRSCTSGNDNDVEEVIAISNNGFIFNNFSSILFSDVTNIEIMDTVTTI